MLAIDLLAPRRRRHEQRNRLDAQQIVEELQRLRVAPVEVVGDEQQRSPAARIARAAASKSRCRCSASDPVSGRMAVDGDGDQVRQQARQLGEVGPIEPVEPRLDAAERSQATTGP